MEHNWNFPPDDSGPFPESEEAYTRLTDARAAAQAHRYDEALEGFIWYHENSRNVPGHGGVRLSFALSNWIELGRAYPPARTALVEVRDRKTETLLNGDRDDAYFRDVVAINKRLGCERATYELFAELNALSPDLAQHYASLALPAVIKAGDLDLVRRFLPSPAVELTRLRDLFNLLIQNGSLQHSVEIYVYGLRELLKTFREIGDVEEAAKIRAAALESFEVPVVRDAIRRELELWE